MSLPTSQELYNQLLNRQATAALEPNKYQSLVDATARKQKALAEKEDPMLRGLRGLEDSYEKRNSIGGQVLGLGMDSDLSRELLGGTASGVGSVAKGIGELGAWIGLGEGETADEVNQWFQGISQYADDAQHVSFRNQMLRSTPEGDLFDPSTWSVDDVSLRGVLGHLAQMGGQFTPQLLAAYVTRGASIATGLATAGSVGGLQAGGGAADGQEQRIEAMDEKELFQASGLYKDLREQGKDHAQAKEETKQAAGKAGFLGAAPVGLLGGAATNYIIRPTTNLLAKSGAGRVVNKTVLSGLEEGTQEVAEGVAAKASSNVAIDGNQDLTEGSLTDFTLGAGFGSGLGTASTLLGATEKGLEAVDKIAERSEIAKEKVEGAKKAAEKAKETGSIEDFKELVTKSPDLAARQASEEFAEGENSEAKEIAKNKMTYISASVQSQLTGLQSLLEKAEEDSDKESIQKRLDDTSTQLEQVKTIQREMLALEADQDAHNKNVEQRLDDAVEAAQESEKGIETFITHAMNHLEGVSEDHFKKALASPKITDDQKRTIRQFSEAQQELLNAKGTEQVTRDITTGSTGFKSLAHYEASVLNAISGGDSKNIVKELSGLKKFGRAKASKYQVAKSILDSGQSGTMVFDADKGVWVPSEEVLNESQRVKQGAFNVHPGSAQTIEKMGLEASLIGGKYKQLKAAYDRYIDKEKKKSPQQSALPDSQSKTEEVKNSPVSSTKQETNLVVGTDTRINSVNEDQKKGRTEKKTDEVTINNLNTTVSTEASDIDTKNEDTFRITKLDERDKNQKDRNNFLAYFTRRSSNLLLSNPTLVRDTSSESLLENQGTLASIEGQGSEAISNYLATLSGKDGYIEKLRSLIKMDVNPDYFYNNPIHFLRDESGQIDEGILTAIATAAYLHIVENASKKYKTKEEVNQSLGRDSKTKLSEEERALLTAGDVPNFVRYSMGQRALQIAGIKPDQDAPLNEIERLTANLGSYAYGLLMSINALETTSFNYTDPDTKETKATQRVRFNRFDSNNNPVDLPKHLQTIVDANKGSGAAVSKIYQLEDTVKFPSDKPSDFKQKRINNTRSKVSQKQQKGLDKEHKKPHSLRMDMLHIWNELDSELLAQFAGISTQEEINALHIDARDSEIARSEGLDREMKHFQEFIDSKEDLSTPFYIPRKVWKIFRVGMDSAINPQTSKIHRHLIRMDGWETTIPLKGEGSRKALNQLKLAVADGIGIDTDKMTNKKSLELFKSEIKPFEPAIQVLKKAHTGERFTDADKEVLANLPEKSFHTLEVLTEYAGYKLAEELKKDSYTTNIMREVDGINNGPILTLMQFGFTGLGGLKNSLNKGGMFFKGQDYKSATDYIEKAENDDLYQTLAKKIDERVRSNYRFIQEQDRSKIAAYFSIVGSFTSPNSDGEREVTSKGRKAVKTPLTAFMFGSSVDKAANGVGQDMIDIYRESLTKAVKDNDSKALDKLVDGINTFLPNNLEFKNITLANALDVPITTEQYKAILNSFDKVIGSQISSVFEQEFPEFIETRNQVNKALQHAETIYKETYDYVRKDYVERLVSEGEIETTTNKKGEVIQSRDLTPKEQAEVEASVKAIEPFLHTMFSKSDQNLQAGYSVLNESQDFSDKHTYKSEAKFTKKIATGKSVSSQGKELTFGSVGVAGTIGAIHSTDSYISFLAYTAEKAAALNVHDANGLGLGDVQKGAERLNQATWDAMLRYSLPIEAVNTLERSINGLNTFLTNRKSNSQDSKEVDQLRTNIITKLGGKDDFVAFVSELKQTAKQATKNKLNAMSEMKLLDQYGMEGGSYQVTQADRKQAKELAQNIQVGTASVESEPRSDAELTWGLIGEPTAPVDKELEQFFKLPGNRKVSEVTTMLRARINQSQSGSVRKANLELLSQIIRALPKDTRFELVTPKTAPIELSKSEKPVAEAIQNTFRAARGFTRTSSNGKSTIYVKSSDFASSGLTPELLLHEMTHAALDMVIAKPNKRTKPLLNELEEIRTELGKVLRSNPEYSHLINAASNVNELIAWGTTNPEVIKILGDMEFKTKNSAVSFMQRFVDLLAKLLMPHKSEQEAVKTALYALTVNASGLYAAENQRLKTLEKRRKEALSDNQGEAVQTETSQSTDEIITSFQAYVNKPRAYTSEQVLQELAEGDNTSPTRVEKLKDILEAVTTRVNGPFGTFALLASESATETMTDTYLNSLLGQKPYVSGLLGRLNLSHAETYVVQQLEMTLNTAIKNNFGNYKELQRIFVHARDVLRDDPSIDADIYNYLFNVKARPEDYLSRFAAAAMVYEPLAQKMEQLNPPTKYQQLTDEKLGGWIQRVVFKILAALEKVMPRTFESLDSHSSLKNLVFGLANNEARNRDLLMKRRTAKASVFEDFTNKMSNKLREGVSKAATSKPISNAPFTAIRATGQIVGAVAGDRGDAVLEHLTNAYNGVSKGRNNFLLELVNEVRGSRGNLSTFYTMLRGANGFQRHRKQIIEQVGKSVLDGFENADEMSREELEALTKVFIRGDMYSLIDKYQSEGLESLLKDSSRLDQEIQNLIGQLSPKYKHYYQKQAQSLGYHLATGRVGGPNMQLNAYNIAYLGNTGQEITQETAQTRKDEKTIDMLASLYAMAYMDVDVKNTAARIFEQENKRGNGENGVEAAIRIHGSLQKEAKMKLFRNDPTNFIKGYTKETFDPNKEIILLAQDKWEEAENMGYNKISELEKARGDSDPRSYALFYTNMGLEPRVTGYFGYTGKRRRGTTLNTSSNSEENGFEVTNKQNVANTQKAQAGQVRKLFTPAPFDPVRNSKEEVFTVPSMGNDGKPVAYRYLMNDKTKELLNPNNQIQQVLGAMAGHAFDKVETEKMNAEGIKALHDNYRLDYHRNPSNYIEFSLNSDDSEVSETYALLPDHTKQEIKKVWGGNKMYVHKDVYNIMFGYRKYSVAAMFDKEREHRNIMENITVEIGRMVLGKKAAQRIKFAGDIWQEIVLWTKDVIVIKNLFTLLGNIAANVSLLLLRGVSARDIYTNHIKAIRGVINYQRDTNELVRLNTMLESGFFGNQTRAEIERRKVELQNAIDSNPVKELADENMFQTIVEDVDTEDNYYSYQSEFSRWVSEKTERVPKGIKTVGKTILMTHDTPLYKILNQSTAMSDFVARYVLYQELTTRKDNRFTKQKALQEIEEAFVQYDIPSHKGLQYMNDMGMVFFTKYFIRIQKALFNAMQENPARSLIMVILNHFYSWLPLVTDSGFFERIGNNPFSTGALEAPSVVDEILPLKVATSIF